MSDIAIRVNGLGKKYHVARIQQRHNTLRDAIAATVRRTASSAGNIARGRLSFRDPGDYFWALQDLTFEVKRGEVVGVIGANGAGKSTLLKILSQITEPTAGEAEIHGRVSSLLEVGTGFHSELTGRENIYLSGAILGMQRHEINRKFDEIVAFSEVEQFIDTPIKHYSSGMSLRLAFSVAAHLEPEILIIDEVLAVGDASFQRKCLGKMGDVAGEGRTVLFVSHNLDAVQRLCSRCLYLEEGHLIEDDDPITVITSYLSRSSERQVPNTWIDLAPAQRRGAGGARFAAVRYSSEDNDAAGHPYPFGPLQFDLKIDSDTARSIASLAVTIRAQAGIKLINADSIAQGQELRLASGSNTIAVRLPELNLNPGVYSVGLWLAASAAGSSVLDWIDSAFEMEVMADPQQSWGVTPGSQGLVASRFQIVQQEPALSVFRSG